MIAVEWNDWDGPRDADGQQFKRIGALLSVGLARMGGHSEPVNVAYVITRAQTWDAGYIYNPNNRPLKVIVTVALNRIIVKGVHLPFETGGTS